MKCQRWHIPLLARQLFSCSLHSRSDSQHESDSQPTLRASIQTEPQSFKLRVKRKTAHQKVVSRWDASEKWRANSIYSVLIYLAQTVLSRWYTVFNKDCGLVESQSALHRCFTFTQRLFFKLLIISHRKYNKATLNKNVAIISTEQKTYEL